jgi:hypothetical protein
MEIDQFPMPACGERMTRLLVPAGGDHGLAERLAERLPGASTPREGGTSCPDAT